MTDEQKRIEQLESELQALKGLVSLLTEVALRKKGYLHLERYLKEVGK